MKTIPLRSKRFIMALLLAIGVSACSTTELSRVADFPLSDDPLLGKIVWHDLITDNVAAARSFYGPVLGWTFEDARHPNGGDYTLIMAAGHYVGGMVELADPSDADYSRWLGYLSVADVDQAVDMTRADGGEVVVGPLDLANIGRAAAIRDPQGAVLGLLRSKLGDPDDGVAAAAGHVVWDELLAADDSAALGFYARLAGFETRSDEREGGVYHFLRSQGQDRAGVMLRPAGDITPVWLTHFAVEDVRAATAQATGLGAEVLIAPSAEFREGMMALVVDPNGAVFILRQLTKQ